MRQVDSTPRVLLVEPTHPLCELLANDLLDRSLAVVTARSGPEVLALLESAEPDGLPDLLVANLELEDMDGWALEEALKQDPLYQRILVLLYSTTSETEDTAGVYTLREIPAAVENSLTLARRLRESWEQEEP